jgi:WD40 repeat protein
MLSFRRLVAVVCLGWPGIAGIALAEPAANVDAYGDALPAGARARLGTLRFRQDGFIDSVAFSPDGKLLASNGYNQKDIYIWDVASGREVRRLPAGNTHLQRLAFAADGKTLAVGRHLWDVETAKPVMEWPGAFVACSTDGRLLFSSDGKAVSVWDLAARRKLREFAGFFVSLTFDGKTVTTGTFNDKTSADWKAFAWDVATGKERCQLPGRFRCPAGPALVIADDTVVRLYDPETGKLRHELVTDSVVGEHPFAFAPDGKTLAISAAKTVSLWDVESGKLLQCLEAPEGGARSLLFDAGGKLLALVSAYDKPVCVYEVATGKLRQRAAVGYSAAFSPDGAQLATGNGQTIRLWEAANGKEIRPRPGHLGLLRFVALSPNGRTVVAGDGTGEPALWEASTGKEIRRFAPKSAPAVFSPDGRTLAWMERGSVVISDVASGKNLHSFAMQKAPVTHLVFSPDGGRLAAAGFDVMNWRLSRPASMLHPPEVAVWDTASGKEIHKVKGRSWREWLFGLAVPSTEAIAPVFLVDNKEADAPVYDLCTGKVIDKLQRVAFPDSPSSALSPDGRLLALSDRQGKIHICELVSGKELRPLGVPQCVQAAFAADSRRLVTIGSDQAVRLWDVATGKELQAWAGASSRPTCAALATDARSLVVGYSNTTALVWTVPVPVVSAGLKPTELDKLWTDLGSAEPPRGYEALAALSADPPAAVGLLKDRLQPIPKDTLPKIRQLITDMQSNQFAVREAAARELEKLGRAAEPALHAVLVDKPPLDLQNRVEALLRTLEKRAASEEDLRLVRSLHLLEYLAIPAARQLLGSLADGAPGALQTREAWAALGRLKARPTDD